MRKSSANFIPAQSTHQDLYNKSSRLRSSFHLIEDLEASQVLEKDFNRTSRRPSGEYLGIFPNLQNHPRITICDSSRVSVTDTTPPKVSYDDTIKGHPNVIPFQISVNKNKSSERLSREPRSERLASSGYIKSSSLQFQGTQSNVTITSGSQGKNRIVTEGEILMRSMLDNITNLKHSKVILTEELDDLKFQTPRTVLDLRETKSDMKSPSKNTAITSSTKPPNGRYTFARTSNKINSVMKDIFAYNNKLPPGRRLEKSSGSPYRFEQSSFTREETSLMSSRTNTSTLMSARDYGVKESKIDNQPKPKILRKNNSETHLAFETFHKKPSKKKDFNFKPQTIEFTEEQSPKNGDESVELAREDLFPKRSSSKGRIFADMNRPSLVDSFEIQYQDDFSRKILNSDRKVKANWEKENGLYTHRERSNNQIDDKIRGRPPLFSAQKQPQMEFLQESTRVPIRDPDKSRSERMNSFPSAINNSISKPILPKTRKGKF